MSKRIPMDKRNLKKVIGMVSPESLSEIGFDAVECERHEPRGSVSWTAWKKSVSKSGRKIAYSYTVVHYLGDLHYENLTDEEYLIGVFSSLMDSELNEEPVIHKGHNAQVFTEMEPPASCYRLHAESSCDDAGSPHGNRQNEDGD